MRYRFIEHTADIKFRAFGNTIEEAFENSALAMFHVMYSGGASKKIRKNISVQGKDFESLLYNFLEELLILFDSEKFFVSEIVRLKIDKKNFKLNTELAGGKAENYKIGTDVKAVTYNEMLVHEKNGKWICQVVVDV